MTEDNVKVLTSVPSEIEAAAIVSVLSERGIEAKATGGLTAGFKAEAPRSSSDLPTGDDEVDSEQEGETCCDRCGHDGLRADTTLFAAWGGVAVMYIHYALRRR